MKVFDKIMIVELMFGGFLAYLVSFLFIYNLLDTSGWPLVGIVLVYVLIPVVFGLSFAAYLLNMYIGDKR